MSLKTFSQLLNPNRLLHHLWLDVSRGQNPCSLKLLRKMYKTVQVGQAQIHVLGMSSNECNTFKFILNCTEKYMYLPLNIHVHI